MSRLVESIVEGVALVWLGGLGWQCVGALTC